MLVEPNRLGEPPPAWPNRPTSTRVDEVHHIDSRPNNGPWMHAADLADNQRFLLNDMERELNLARQNKAEADRRLAAIERAKQAMLSNNENNARNQQTGRWVEARQFKFHFFSFFSP